MDRIYYCVRHLVRVRENQRFLSTGMEFSKMYMQHEQWSKVDITVSSHHFLANMTVSWPSAYVVFTLSRSV